MTVDTGSNISIVRPDILRGINHNLIHPVSSCLRTVTGERAPIHGKGLLHLGIGSLVVQQELWVADIHDECILGLDFLQSNGCQVNLRDQALVIGDEEFPLRKPSTSPRPNCCRVVLTKKVCLAPLAEAIVPVEVDPVHTDYRVGLLEQTQPSPFGSLLVGRTLVDLEKDRIPLRVMNLSHQPLTLKKGTEVAHCNLVSAIIVPDETISCEEPMENVRRTRSVEILPTHLRDLYNRSILGLEEAKHPEVHQLLCCYSDVFSTGPEDIGCTDLVKHHINTGQAAPVRQPPRRLPLAKREEAEKAVREMKERDVIEPSASPWSSPIVLVQKKDGGMRFCVDYRKLNDVTHKDSYPLPRIDDTLEALSGAKWFSALDLKSGYWQVQLDDNSKEKTAFSTGSGLWQFKVMPFGLCNAPATFERLMEQVLVGLPTSIALVYLDDILVPGRTFSQELANLRQVFERLREAKLKLSPKKCTLFQKEVNYLGHVVNEKGISPDPCKVEAVKSWPKPTTATEVKSFLGLCSYYRRFISFFADIAHPLHQSATVSPFEWTQEADDAFSKLKQMLTESPILAYPQLDVEFVLDTDASSTGIGAVLSQQVNGQERVVAYFSRALKAPERHYCVTRKELLAMVKAIRHFHAYLYGRKFRLRTDHSALRWLLNFRHPEGQTARWIESLQQYDFSVEHRPGVQHTNADALSRRPCLRDTCRHCERLESREWGNKPHDRITGQDVPQVATLALSGPEPTGGRSWENLREAQLCDPEIKPVLEWMERSKDKPSWEETASHPPATKVYCAQWESLKIFHGVLYRLWETPSGDATVRQLVLPKSLRREVLQELHNAPTSGHLGMAKTLSRVRERFYWLQCRRDVQEWCRSCDLCAQKRGPQRKPKAPLRTYNVGSPLERIAIDVLGPLPPTEAGNKYILVIADYFTKWVEAYPMVNQEAGTIAELLVQEFISRFGMPLIIHTDQGRNFESALFAEMCKLLDIQKTRTTPYHPQSDGMVERFNRTLEALLSKFVDHNQKDWDEHLQILLMSYRSAVHESTGCSPAKLMMGRELTLPVDLTFGRPEEEEPQTTVEYTNALHERLERVHDFARNHLKLVTDRMRQRYDSSPECHRLQPGDAVWLHNPQRTKGLSPKLQRPWQGPFTVIKRINDVVYRIKLSPTAKPKVVHRNRLWSYTGASPPTWFRAQEQTVSAPCTTTDPQADSVPRDSSSQPRRSSRTRRPPDRYHS